MLVARRPVVGFFSVLAVRSDEERVAAPFAPDVARLVLRALVDADAVLLRDLEEVVTAAFDEGALAFDRLEAGAAATFDAASFWDKPASARPRVVPFRGGAAAGLTEVRPATEARGAGSVMAARRGLLGRVLSSGA